jgi:hypothetical protein
MKKTYKTYKIKLGLLAFIFLAITKSSGQLSYSFTPCGATGSVGPTQTQVNNTYSTTNLNGLVTTTISGIQTWTAPYSGNFRIEARGAQGGISNSTGGALGAKMSGDFSLTGGEVIWILVGQQGDNGGTGPGGGGGGSFVVRTPYTTTSSILVIAGGGSGNGQYGTSQGVFSSSGASGGVSGGSNGNGGLGGTRGAGGGGFLTDGSNCTVNSNYASPGQAFVNGGRGGPKTNHTCNFTANGGFGGGSSHGGNCINNGGAGGGFSGGGGSSNTTSGGGGSLNQGSNQINTSGTNSGDGMVIITELCSIQVYASGSNSVNPQICSGNTLTLTTNAVSGYSWSTGQTTSSIVVAPTANTVYSVTGTSSLSCTATGILSVSVSPGLPVLSVINASPSICLGLTATLTASGATTYSWTGGIQNGITFTPTTTQNYTVTGTNGCGSSTSITTISVAPLSVSASVSPTLVCQGEPAVLSASSAVTGYTWQPFGIPGASLTVLPTSNTIYTVTASNGTCSGTETVSLLTKQTPTLSISATSSLICNGESVTITVSGASAYTWTPGNTSGTTIVVSPTTAAIYAVDGTNTLGCTSSAQHLILVNYGPTVSVVANKTMVCTGQPIVLSASGASSYNWTNGPATPVYSINPTANTIYTVTGSHSANNCTTSRTIAVNAIVPAVTAPTSTSVCAGNTVALVSGGATTYSWNGFTSGGNPVYVVQPSGTTLYTLVANTQSGQVSCPLSFTAQVTVNPLPTISVTPTRPVICRFETNTLTATGGTSYDWGNAGSGTGNTIVVTLSATAVYTIMGTDDNGCHKVFSYQVLVNSCTGLPERAAEHELSVFPNPNNGEFVIESDVEMVVSLVTQTGQLVQTIRLEENGSYKLSNANLANGVYFLTGHSGNRTINQKIVVIK